MKINSITFHKAHNYGAILQAYALQKALCKKNDVKIIDFDNEKVFLQYNPKKIKRNNIKWTIKNLIDILFYRKLLFTRYNNFNNFIETKLILTNRAMNKEEVINISAKADVLITGSDQVWNPGITGELSDVYTLNFGDDKIKRISYAASIGNEKNVQNYEEEYVEKLSKLDKISVREESAKRELEKILPEKNIEVVLDPTLLLTKEEWNEEIKELSSENEKYILAYVVKEDENFLKITNELSKQTGYKIIHFSKNNKGLKNVLRSAYIEGPLEFVNLIKNAEYVVATSFHATVFSIIFNKKFWIVPHETTGSRVSDLLKKLGISNRAIRTFEEFKEKNYDEEIDYESVNKILEKERKKSIDWLNNAIEK